MIDFGTKLTPELIDNLYSSGYDVIWRDNSWLYNGADEIAIQGIIDAYDPMPYLRAQKLKEVQIEAGIRLRRILPYLDVMWDTYQQMGVDDLSAYRLTMASLEIIKEIYPALNSADIPADLECAKDIFIFKNTTAPNYINNPARTQAELEALDIPNHPAWPSCSDPV